MTIKYIKSILGQNSHQFIIIQLVIQYKMNNIMNKMKRKSLRRNRGAIITLKDSSSRSN